MTTNPVPYFEAVLNPSTGELLKNEPVAVKVFSSSSLATIYSDQARTALTNPASTDANGNLHFWVDKGVYFLRYRGQDSPPFLMAADPTDPGVAGNYVYNQTTPDNVWIITHNLGFKPNVRVIDSSGNNEEGQIVWPDNNTVTLRFNVAFDGTAYLS